MKEKRVIGIDIGGTNTIIALVDSKGELSLQKHLRTKVYPSAEAYIDGLRDAIRHIQLEVAREVEICGIGVGAPNGNFYTGRIEFAPNMPWRGIIDLAPSLQESLNIPVVLTNDANAAALGEKRYGGAKDMTNFMVITIGTGLGSGIMVNGEILYGHSGFAGELGHTVAQHDGRPCTCGKKGCLETYVSARGLKETLREFLRAGTTSSTLHIDEVDDLSAHGVHKLAEAGDPAAAAAFERTGMILGRHLADAVAYTSPEAIFLFGGLANAGSRLLDPTRKFMEANLLNIFRNEVRLLPSELLGKNAAILGGAAMAWEIRCEVKSEA